MMKEVMCECELDTSTSGHIYIYICDPLASLCEEDSVSSRPIKHGQFLKSAGLLQEDIKYLENCILLVRVFQIKEELMGMYAEG
jgi:hypothetical protein